MYISTEQKRALVIEMLVDTSEKKFCRRLKPVGFRMAADGAVHEIRSCLNELQKLIDQFQGVLELEEDDGLHINESWSTF